MNTYEKLVTMIKSQNGDDEVFDVESNLIDMGYNSHKFVELVIKIESEFEIEFGDDDLDYRNFVAVKDLVDYIESKR